MSNMVSVPISVEKRAFLKFWWRGCDRSAGRPSVVESFVFVFLTPSLIYVPIFVENRAFLNFGGVGRGRSSGRRSSVPLFSFFSHRV